MIVSEKDKKRLLFVLLVSIMALGYYYIYVPFNQTINDLNNEVTRLEARYRVLKAKMASKDALISDIKDTRYQSAKIEEKLPSYIEQERVIITLNELSQKAGLQVNNPVFSKVVAITDQKEISTQLKQIPKGQEEEKQREDEGEKFITYTEFLDSTGIKKEVRINFTSTYAQLKKFLYEVSNHNNKVIANNLTITGQDDDLSGGMTLSFYGLVERDRLLPKWQSDIEKGKINPFSDILSRE